MNILYRVPIHSLYYRHNKVKIFIGFSKEHIHCHYLLIKNLFLAHHQSLFLETKYSSTLVDQLTSVDFKGKVYTNNKITKTETLNEALQT